MHGQLIFSGSKKGIILKYKELIIGTTVGKNNITLDPFQTIWLSN